MLSQPQQEVPSLSQTDVHTSQGTLSHKDHVSPDSHKEKRTDSFGETPVGPQDSLQQKPSSLGVHQTNIYHSQYPFPSQLVVNYRDGYDHGYYDSYQGQ